MRRKNGKGTVVGIVGTVAVLLVVIVVVLFVQEKKNPAIARQGGSRTQSGTEEGASDYSEITYNGEQYTYNKDLKTILFLGIDKNQDEVDQDIVGTEGQSDCMILIVVNTKDGTAQMVAIPRETMVDVEAYYSDGTYYGMQNEQICLQYAYGENSKKGCWLTKKAVSRLMNNIPIDAYLAMELSGISDITELMGGVTITVPNDYTAIDPSFAQGATVNLEGALAEKYVRSRDCSEFASNEDRMERQNQFIRAFVPQMKEKFASDIPSLLKMTSDYLTTDMDAGEMKELVSCNLADETMTVPGQRISTGDDTPEEFYADEDALTQMIVDLCYEKKQ